MKILREAHLFSGVSETDLEALADLAVSRDFPRQASIFWEGKEPQGFYMLVTGLVKLVKTSPDGKEYIIRLVQPGETFGEAVVFADSPYPATAMTLEDCQTLFFPKKVFLQYLAASPALARNMLATLSRLLYHLTRQLEDVSLKEVSARLARYLLERCQETHGRVAAGLTFALPTTKTHLAAYLGTISETLSRTLARFKSLGAIEMEKGKITINDPALLQNMAKGTKS
ncbi:MAG: Crp/Fnr family transcriptional regulator [Deltaproteobacteria bacterium]|nr:Crp/Fnr family transcriptional regulator [Deltaproteobacteria bacterium]MBI4794733.1 Crp/Fnr family transcriptional regulator [Deltaproteobacteria bacterium]